MVPAGSFLNARNHPVGLSLQERANTRSSTTTTQTPVYRCSAPARTPSIFAFRNCSTRSSLNVSRLPMRAQYTGSIRENSANGDKGLDHHAETEVATKRHKNHKEI